MKHRKFFLNTMILLAVLILASNCTAISSQPQETPVSPASVSTTPAEATQAPTQVPTQETPEPLAETGVQGFVVFDQEQGSFRAYSPDGEELFNLPAPGIEYPSPFSTSIVNGAIYYMMERNRAKNQEPQLFRTGADGIKEVNIPAQYLAALSVSPDEKWIAWSNLGPENGESELWIAQADGSQARKIAKYNYKQSEAFFLRPFAWTDDGKLIFERSLTGIGGYILFGGHNSLYQYNPETEEFVTIVPAEEMHGLCLDSYRLDLEKVVFNCSKKGPEIVIRDLKTMQEVTLPSLPGQGAAGSARYSPSGAWIAYAVAANQPEDESGQIVVIPADQSAAAQPIIDITGNMYGYVQGWLDEDTLVFSRVQWPNSEIIKVRRDGSDMETIAQGMWMGWLP